MSLERSLLAAQGYAELGMPDEALRELDAMEPAERGCEDAWQMRLFVFMRSRRWPDAMGVCDVLRREYPEDTTGFIHGAFCLHELGRTQEAKDLLLTGPVSLCEDATYHYNLGCYDAVLGNLDEATRHLQTSFRIDKKFLEIARYDPDLNAVKEFLGK